MKINQVNGVSPEFMFLEGVECSLCANYKQDYRDCDLQILSIVLVSPAWCITIRSHSYAIALKIYMTFMGTTVCNLDLACCETHGPNTY